MPVAPLRRCMGGRGVVGVIVFDMHGIQYGNHVIIILAFRYHVHVRTVQYNVTRWVTFLLGHTHEQ